MEDAESCGDKGMNTLLSVSVNPEFDMPNMRESGLYNLDSVTCGEKVAALTARIVRMREAFPGKDITIGHWEIAGIVSKKLLSTYRDGFLGEVFAAFCRATGRGVW